MKLYQAKSTVFRRKPHIWSLACILGTNLPNAFKILFKYRLNHLLVNENYVKISELKLPSACVALRIKNLYLLKLS